MARIQVTLTSSANTQHVPVAALGYAFRRAGLLKPLYDVVLPIKTVQHSPGDKLVEALALVLVGGRATAQVDLLLRPNRGLAQAWGQAQFAQQSTLADTLDAFDALSLRSLRAAFETILGQCSWALAHDFRTGALRLDGDLTGLPASRRAEGSTKGYFGGEKTAVVAKWRESVRPPMAKPWARWSTRVRPRVWRHCSRWSNCLSGSWA
jgi:hypothetical protein